MIPMFPNSSTVSFWRDSPKQNLSPVSRPSFAFHEGKRTCNVTCSTWSNGTVKRATERSPRGKKFGAMLHGKQMGSFLQFVFCSSIELKTQGFHQSYLKNQVIKKNNWHLQGFEWISRICSMIMLWSWGQEPHQPSLVGYRTVHGLTNPLCSHDLLATQWLQYYSHNTEMLAWLILFRQNDINYCSFIFAYCIHTGRLTWNLQINTNHPFRKEPPWLCSMLIFRDVSFELNIAHHLTCLPLCSKGKVKTTWRFFYEYGFIW